MWLAIFLWNSVKFIFKICISRNICAPTLLGNADSMNDPHSPEIFTALSCLPTYWTRKKKTDYLAVMDKKWEVLLQHCNLSPHRCTRLGWDDGDDIPENRLSPHYLSMLMRETHCLVVIIKHNDSPWRWYYKLSLLTVVLSPKDYWRRNPWVEKTFWWSLRSKSFNCAPLSKRRRLQTENKASGRSWLPMSNQSEMASPSSG